MLIELIWVDEVIFSNDFFCKWREIWFRTLKQTKMLITFLKTRWSCHFLQSHMTLFRFSWGWFLVFLVQILCEILPLSELAPVRTSPALPYSVSFVSSQRVLPSLYKMWQGTAFLTWSPREVSESACTPCYSILKNVTLMSVGILYGNFKWGIIKINNIFVLFIFELPSASRSHFIHRIKWNPMCVLILYGWGCVMRWFLCNR